jgi:hypothetical protein
LRLVVVEFMTLDGVMEAPGFEEHRDGRNAWALRVDDEELQRRRPTRSPPTASPRGARARRL